MIEPEKYVFKELSSDFIVKTPKNNEEQDETIVEAVVAHLNAVVSGEAGEGDQPKHEHPFYAEKDQKLIKETLYNEGHEKGFNEAKSLYEAQKTESTNNEELLASINDKLAQILPVKDPVGQYVDLLAEILTELTDKLVLILPSDFTSVLKNQLKHLLENCYEGGKVIIKINEKQKELAEEIIKNEQLAAKINAIEVATDSKLADNECIVEYNETKIVYDKALIKKEIDEIVKQFKLDS